MENNKVYMGTVNGTVVSKSNSYRIITINGHGSLTKDRVININI